MHSIKPLLAGIFLAAGLSGCVIVDGDFEGLDRAQHGSDWESVEKHNRSKIANLSIGDTYRSVIDSMDAANFSEAFEANGDQYQVLYYRTHRTRRDGDTTMDETTALVFKNRLLIGWGDDALQRIPKS